MIYFNAMMSELDEAMSPVLPEFSCRCGCANGECVCRVTVVGERVLPEIPGDHCVFDSANGECTCMTGGIEVEVQGQQTVLQLKQAPVGIDRGRTVVRRGRINRSRSLMNKPLNKEDSMTQPVITTWSNLFVRRRASSVDSPRVSPQGDKAAPASPISISSLPQDISQSEEEVAQLAPWGDTLVTIEEGKVLRFVYQNVAHSLSTRGSDPGLPQLAAHLRDIQCGVAVFSETNINWRQNKYSYEVRRVLQEASSVHMSTTCSGMGAETEYKNKRFLPGGAAVLTFNHWACTVVESGRDEFDCGWWCFTTLQGRNKKRLTNVGFYRSNKPSSNSGPTTAHAQAMKSLENEKLTKQDVRKVLIPREEMVQRVEEKIRGWQQRGDSIMFFGDGNETPSECDMKVGKKRYSMAWLFETTGMTDVLRNHHNAPLTTTTTPGRPIDWIGSWRVPILRVGRFEENFPAISDHLGFFVDIDMVGLMGGVYDVLKLPKLRKLTVKNVTARTAYEIFVTKQWEVHKIAERANALHDRAVRGEFTAYDFMLLNALDSQITEILLGAEQRCSKKLVDRDKWSPRLQIGARNILYWRARLHSYNDYSSVSKRALERYRRQAFVSLEEHDTCLSRNAIKQKLREAWQLHRNFQRQAGEWRQQHLQARAEELAGRQDTTKEKAVKAIKHHERTRQRFSRIRRANGTMKRGLIQIEVQDPATRERVMLTEKDSVNDALLTRNELHLQEPNFTPFGMIGALYPLVDPTNPGNQIDALLQGNAVLPESCSNNVEIQQWVKNLQRKNMDEIQLKISSEDFVRYFGRKKENTASSPSERHYGHMKVIANMEQSVVRDTIVQIAATALVTKQPLDRWLRCTQVMLDKGKGVFINNLRIIQLLEADLNFILGFIWSTRLNQAANNSNLFNTSQFALSGKTCNSAVLKKVLFFDLLRQTQQSGSIVDFDAKAAYDSIIPALATVTCMRMGLPKFAGDFMTQLITQMEYSVATGLGESTKTYKAGANPFFMCQGGMQGSTSAAPIYNIHHDVSLSTYCEHGTPAAFQHPNPAEGKTEDYAAQFVDDHQQQKSLLGLLRHYSAELHQCTSAAEVDALLVRVTNDDANRWCQYSFCAGGTINASKCFWQLIKPVQCPNSGQISYTTAVECPGEVYLKHPDDMEIQDTIPRFEANVANRTLGARLAPDGNVRAELKSRYDKAKQWSTSLRKAQLSNDDCWAAYNSCVRPAVSYPLMGQQCTVEDLSPTQSVMDQIACHALGLNEHFPRALLHGPVSLGGIGVPTLWADSLADKLAYFVHHMRVRDDVGIQLSVSLAITQLEVGVGVPFFQLPFETWGFLATKSWVVHLWQSCSRASIDLQAAEGKHWLPPLQTESDGYIMDILTQKYSRKACIKLNHCRRFLQVVTTSDLFLHDGSRIHPEIYRGQRASGRAPQYEWPEISPPSRSCWTLWKQFLRSAFPAGIHLHAADETWCDLATYSHKLLCRYDETSGSLYRLAGEQWWRHDKRRAPALRGVMAKCSLTGCLHEGQPPDSSIWVEIEYVKDAIVIVAASLREAAAMRRLGHEDEEDAQVEPVCLAERLRALPSALKRIVGKVVIPADGGQALIDSLRNGEKIFGASDGSASKGLAAHGWKITRRPNDSLAIKGCGPVDGAKPNAFRAEMQGQVAILIVSSLLAAERGIRQARIISLCDNQATLRRLAAHSKSLRVRDHTDSEVDLYLVYREWMKKKHVHCTHRWVKGHQDRKKPLHEISEEGLLNIEVDELATSAYTTEGVGRTVLEGEVFDAEVYSVFIEGSKVTSKFKRQVVDKCGASTMLQYLYHKHKLSEGKIDGIDWHSLEKYLRSLPPHRRATQVKLQHNWTPTNSFLYLQRRVPCDKCPLCKSATETASHVRWCKAPEAQKYRRARLAQLARELKGINTAPEIVRTWCENIALLCGESSDEHITPPFTITPIERLLGEARRHQAVLSWEGLLQGRISNCWQGVQRCHECVRRQETASFGRGDSWSIRAVRLVCEFNSDLWSFRNTTVHGNTAKEAQQKLRAAVEEQVRRLYDRYPILLARYPSVRAVPLDVRLRKPTLTLQMWLKQVAQQEKLTDIARMKAKMKEGSIIRFLLPRTVIARQEHFDSGQQEEAQWTAAYTLVRWVRRCLRFRSNVELPRAGIGDPG